jgi:hypothetical protein
MSLSTKTMIVKLSTQLLGTSGKDNDATDVVNSFLQTSLQAGYYKKCKIDTASLKPLMTVVRQARDYHRTVTRPFGDDKWRMLPATKVKEYTQKMRGFKQDFKMEISDLESTWPAVIARQKLRLDSTKGTLFNPEDYPYVEPDPNGSAPYIISKPVKLDHFYSMDYELSPTPDEGHIIIDLEAETIQELKDDLNKKNKKKLEDSKLELWRRLIDPVKNMAKICTEDKSVHKSLTKNIEKELSILSDLNVTNDIDLTNAIKEIKDQLTGYTPGQIRHDKGLKKDLGNKAAVLTDKMQQIGLKRSTLGQTT